MWSCVMRTRTPSLVPDKQTHDVTARIALFAACAITLAACQTDGAGPIAAGGSTTAVQQAPMTRSRASTECWMRTEKTGVRDNLDKRVDIVNKCIDEKMKAAGAS